VVAGPEGSGKSLLLRRLRGEADAPRTHFVLLNNLSHLPDPDLRLYAIIAGVADAHAGEGDHGPSTPLLANPDEFVGNLMQADARSPSEKLLSLFSVASAHLADEARLVLFLDLGRLDDEDAFPLEFLARRLPGKVKLVAAVPSVPPGLAQLDNATVVTDLPALTEIDVARLVRFHQRNRAADPQFVRALLTRYKGRPMPTDLAAKLVSSPTPAALEALPADLPNLCRRLLDGLNDDQSRLADCIARVPSGVDVPSLKALRGFSDADLRKLLNSDGIRNIVIIQRSARGPEALLFHEMIVDLIQAEPLPDSDDLHAKAAAYFLALAQNEPANVVALSAHACHIRLAGSRRQFIQDFAKTYRTKHDLRLFHHLADEYRYLLECCDELGEGTVNRPVCVANLGRVYQQLGQSDDALRCHRDALGIYEEQSDDSGTAAQLANIASVLQDIGQLDEACEHLERAVVLDEAVGNEPALAADLNNLGILCQRLERYGEALQHHQRALELHRKLSNDVGVANQLANLAAIQRKQGDLEAARTCYQEAWRLDNRTGSTLAEIADLCNLGLIFEELGDMAKAVSCYQQAIELDRTVADREAEAAHRRTLAAMHHKLHQGREALAVLEEALEIDRSIGNLRGEVADVIAMARTHRAVGDAPAARSLLERAAMLAAGIDDALEAQARRALEHVDEPPDAEAADEETREPAPQQPIVEREPAGGDLWENLQLLDDLPAAPDEHGLDTELEATTPEGDPQDAAAIIATLERQRDDAVRRCTELEAELEAYKKIVQRLKSIVGQASRPD